MSVYNAHPELTNVEQAEAVLVKVGKLIKLPEGEMPSMATIEDAESVKTGQPFLASAEDGDILIVYAEAATALLYRPSTNILIAVGPVTGETPTEPEMTQVTPLDEEVDTEDTASPTEE